MTLYDTLGVDKTASEKEIKEAYKKKAKKNHPDKGGSSEEMALINRAYDILGDKERREKYDTTGSEENSSFENKFFQFVNEIFMQLINTVTEPDTTDVIGAFKTQIRQIISKFKNKQKENKEKKIKLEKIIKRIKTKKDNTLITVLNGHLTDCDNAINGIENELAFLNQCLSIVNFYYYDYEEKPKEEYQPFERIIFNQAFANVMKQEEEE